MHMLLVSSRCENIWFTLGIGVAGFFSGMAMSLSDISLFLVNPFVLMMKPAVASTANLMLVLTLVTGTVVVSLLLCMWMRTRQKEVAIFMSLGKTKSEIFLQTLLEAGSVFTLSVLGATAIGKLFSGVLQNVITGSETVTENLKVVLQIQDIGMLFLLGGAVILVALCCSILPILRANPKDILAKMEG